jgi:hypothetical protein
MGKFFLQLVVAFLLISIAAETFSAVYITSDGYTVFAEKEENGKEEQKEKQETAKDEYKDKIYTGSEIKTICIKESSLWPGYLHPELIQRQPTPPEMPPEFV